MLIIKHQQPIYRILPKIYRVIIIPQIPYSIYYYIILEVIIHVRSRSPVASVLPYSGQASQFSHCKIITKLGLTNWVRQLSKNKFNRDISSKILLQTVVTHHFFLINSGDIKRFKCHNRVKLYTVDVNIEIRTWNVQKITRNIYF